MKLQGDLKGSTQGNSKLKEFLSCDEEIRFKSVCVLMFVYVCIGVCVCWCMCVLLLCECGWKQEEKWGISVAFLNFVFNNIKERDMHILDIDFFVKKSIFLHFRY